MFVLQVIRCLQCNILMKHDGESGKWPQPGNSGLNDTRWRNSRHLLWSDSSHCFHPDLVTVSPPLPPRRTQWLQSRCLSVLCLGSVWTGGSSRHLLRLFLLLKQTIPIVWHSNPDKLSRAVMFCKSSVCCCFSWEFSAGSVTTGDLEFLYPKLNFGETLS